MMNELLFLQLRSFVSPTQPSIGQAPSRDKSRSNYIICASTYTPNQAPMFTHSSQPVFNPPIFFPSTNCQTVAVSAPAPITPLLPPVAAVWSGRGHSETSVSFVAAVLCHTSAWRHQTAFDDDSFKIFAFEAVRLGWLEARWTKGGYGKYPSGWRVMLLAAERGAELFWLSAGRMSYDGGRLTARHCRQ